MHSFVKQTHSVMCARPIHISRSRQCFLVKLHNFNSLRVARSHPPASIFSVGWDFSLFFFFIYILGWMEGWERRVAVMLEDDQKFMLGKKTCLRR